MLQSLHPRNESLLANWMFVMWDDKWKYIWSPKKNNHRIPGASSFAVLYYLFKVYGTGYHWLIIILPLWLPVSFFNVLCHKEPCICELLYIWYIVILGNVNTTASSQQKREAASDYPHLQMLCSWKKDKIILVVSLIKSWKEEQRDHTTLMKFAERD